MSDDVLSQIPALKAPLGTVSNFKAPNPNRYALLTSVIVSVTLTSLVLGIRIFVRLWGPKRMAWEDYISIFAWLCLMGYIGISIICYDQGVGQHQWNLSILGLETLSKQIYINGVLYAPTVAIAKVAILLQFRKLFVSTKRNVMYWGVHILIWTNSIFYCIVTFLGIFDCAPIPRNWNPLVQGACSFNIHNVWIATGAWNVFSDFSILILPIYSTWKLQMPTRNKIGVSAIFALGVFACIASIVRLIYTIRLLTAEDFTYAVFPVGLWGDVEIATVIFCGSLPILPGFFKLLFRSTKKKFSHHQTPQHRHTFSSHSYTHRDPNRNLSRTSDESNRTFFRKLLPKTSTSWLFRSEPVNSSAAVGTTGTMESYVSSGSVESGQGNEHYDQGWGDNGSAATFAGTEKGSETRSGLLDGGLLQSSQVAPPVPEKDRDIERVSSRDHPTSTIVDLYVDAVRGHDVHTTVDDRDRGRGGIWRTVRIESQSECQDGDGIPPV